MRNLVVFPLLFSTCCLSATAAVCDYAPSKQFATGAAAVGAGTVATAGVGLKTAGFYTIVHSVTGAAMVGSTAAGASAAGTVGIMAGTAGVIGTVGAVLMSPFVIIPAAVVAGGTVLYESGCYLKNK